MTDQMLTVRQAFRAMRYFLEQYNEREHSESVAQLIRWTDEGDWAGGITFDPAQWHDWLAAVKRALGDPITEG